MGHSNLADVTCVIDYAGGYLACNLAICESVCVKTLTLPHAGDHPFDGLVEEHVGPSRIRTGSPLDGRR